MVDRSDVEDARQALDALRPRLVDEESFEVLERLVRQLEIEHPPIEDGMTRLRNRMDRIRRKMHDGTQTMP